MLACSDDGPARCPHRRGSRPRARLPPQHAARASPSCPPSPTCCPNGGLRPGSMVSITGIGATSLALGLIAEASKTSWTACVGMPELGLAAGEELGVDLDRLVVVPDPKDRGRTSSPRSSTRSTSSLAHPPRHAHRTQARPDACASATPSSSPSAQWPDSDVRLEGAARTWRGIGARTRTPRRAHARRHRHRTPRGGASETHDALAPGRRRRDPRRERRTVVPLRETGGAGVSPARMA